MTPRPPVAEAILTVKAQPGASRERIVGRLGDAVKIAVTAPPEKGKANQAIERLLAREFGISPGGVEVVLGGGSQLKRVRLRGVTPARAAQWFAELP